jgi:hypothetical protein
VRTDKCRRKYLLLGKQYRRSRLVLGLAVGGLGTPVRSEIGRHQALAERATMLKHPGQSLVAATPHWEIFALNAFPICLKTPLDSD